MKKIIIYILLFGVLAGISPIIGNKIVTYYVEEEIITLREKGITLNFKSETPGYFYTSKQYEFILTDVEAFAAYLTEYGAGLIPPYTDEFLKGIVFRLDMKYNNIPFLEPISVDIYPMYLSDGMMEKLQGSNNIFFKNFRKFIRKQGILYHIDYNLLSESYRGHIQNIDYDERAYDGSNLILTLHNAIFNGTGSFSGPQSLHSDIDKIMFKTTDTSKDVTVEITKFSSESSKTLEKKAEELYDKSQEFYEKSKKMYKDSEIPEQINEIKEKSEDTAREMYNTSLKMQSMFFNTKDKSTKKEVTIEAKDVEVDVSSEEDKEKSKNRSYFFFESLNLHTQEMDVKMSKVVYDSSMSGVDKESFRNLQAQLKKIKIDPSLNLLSEIKVSGINLLSHGLELKVPELSVKNVNFYGEDLGGLKLISALHVKEDENLAAKMLFSPLFIVQNLDFKVNLTVSKKMYKKFVEEVPLAILAHSATKQTANDITYDISYINGNLKVNGTSVL